MNRGIEKDQTSRKSKETRNDKTKDRKQELNVQGDSNEHDPTA